MTGPADRSVVTTGSVRNRVSENGRDWLTNRIDSFSVNFL